MMNLRRAFTESQERHTTFSSKLVQVDWMTAFRGSKLGRKSSETSIFKIDQKEKSMILISDLEGVHIWMSPNPSFSVQKRLTDSHRPDDRCVSWNIVLYEDLLVLKSFCEPSKNFFLQHAKVNSAVDFQALINEHQTRFAHV